MASHKRAVDPTPAEFDQAMKVAKHKNTRFARRSYYCRTLKPFFSVHSRKHQISITEAEYNCLLGINVNKKMLVPRKAHDVLVGNHSMSAAVALKIYRNITRLVKEGYNIQTYISI